MEHLQAPSTVAIKGEVFDVVKPTRLMLGMVLKSCEREVYARMGQKQSTLEEQIHTVSLHERGFPVARVLESGENGNEEWYFIEESLGEKTFHELFATEYQQNGVVSDKTYEQYLSILEQYIRAQFADSNRSTVTAREFVETVIPESTIIENYQACGKDIERYRLAIHRATQKLADAPMGILQQDLNPYNVLERGMIDFELVGYGPLGYDTLLVSIWHRWFTSDSTSRYHIAYYLSDTQINAAIRLVTTAAEAANVPDPSIYVQEFVLLKSAWAFTSHKSINNEPESKRAFYEYRARLLELCVESYLADKAINPLDFPEVRA